MSWSSILRCLASIIACDGEKIYATAMQKNINNPRPNARHKHASESKFRVDSLSASVSTRAYSGIETLCNTMVLIYIKDQHKIQLLEIFFAEILFCINTVDKSISNATKLCSKIPDLGIEPRTPGLEVRCAVHCARQAILTHFFSQMDSIFEKSIFKYNIL